MPNMLGVDPALASVKRTLMNGVQAPEPVVADTTGQPTPVPSPSFAPMPVVAPTMAPAADVTGAIRSRIAPQHGQTRTFPNGRIGQWDGKGWAHVG